MLKELKLFLGFSRNSTSSTEKLVALFTSFVGMYGVFVMGKSFDTTSSLFSNCFVLIPMAASAVLLFAIPHGALSQPWPLFGGHFFSALIGVTCKSILGSNLGSATLAVSLSIYVMSLMRCIHPPGGATSLSAVMGGESIYDLGYLYVLFPVAYSTLIMFSLSFIVNFPFKWRRYPAHLFHLQNTIERVKAENRHSEVTLEDFLYAVNKHDSYIDITDETWIEIFETAKISAEKNVRHPDTILVNSHYSNGRLGKEWQIRTVSEINVSKKPYRNKTVVYQVVAGKNIGDFGQENEKNFLSWSKFEVQNVNGSWQRFETI